MRPATSSAHDKTTTQGIKRRKTEIRLGKWTHLTGQNDSQSQPAPTETPEQLLARRRREMQAYDLSHPLPLVDIVIDKEEAEREEEYPQDDQKMELSDDWTEVEEQQTQTNKLADPSARFDRFLGCWLPLAPHQRNYPWQASLSASVASTDEELSQVGSGGIVCVCVCVCVCV